MSLSIAALASWMRKNDVSQCELARRIGTSQASVQRWCHGAQPRMATMITLMRVTGLSLAVLMPASAAKRRVRRGAK